MPSRVAGASTGPMRRRSLCTCTMSPRRMRSACSEVANSSRERRFMSGGDDLDELAHTEEAELHQVLLGKGLPRLLRDLEQEHHAVQGVEDALAQVGVDAGARLGVVQRLAQRFVDELQCLLLGHGHASNFRMLDAQESPTPKPEMSTVFPRRAPPSPSSASSSGMEEETVLPTRSRFIGIFSAGMRSRVQRVCSMKRLAWCST